MTTASVLYVDDEVMALKYFERLISPQYKVLTAPSVAEGIKILQAQGSEISVLISDQRMPGATGNELLRYAREHYPKILRILTTAYSELGEAIVAINAGEIYRYITKPWDLEMLRTEVRLAVEVSSLRSERDELIQAKIQVQQSQLLANRVNNLALACGRDAPASAALQHYLEAIKRLGGVALAVDWKALHYTDWMQNEAVRHAAVAVYIQHWLSVWHDPSIADLMTALGDAPLQSQTLTHLLADNSKTPSERDCATLAWFIAVERAGKHSIQMTVAADGQLRLDLGAHIAPTLTQDWLAHAMENLEAQG